MSCYRRRWYAARFFGGNPESVLERNGRACRGCQSQHYFNVHHRQPGDHTQLLRLSAGRHVGTRILERWLPEIWSGFGPY